MQQTKACYICNSSKGLIDNHHIDCQEGNLSPERVPLCRRCHRSYHDWGIGSFSPDTTDKVVEVENKRREILRSLPAGHPSYCNLPLLKPEDVKRSGYWYKKHGIAPPISPIVKSKKPVQKLREKGARLDGEEKPEKPEPKPSQRELLVAAGQLEFWR